MYHESEKLFPHEIECAECQFLGNFDGWDLYFCEQSNAPHHIPVLQAVNPDVRDIAWIAAESTTCSRNPVLAEALKRANNAGLKLRDQRQEA